MGSSFRSEGKRLRLKHPRQPMYSFGGLKLKRDPVIETIIESRKFSIIENSYTRLAQVTTQAPRLSRRANPFELRPQTIEIENDITDRILSSQSGKRIAATELENEEWDDGITGEYEKGTRKFIVKKKKI
jgi:hypothetical protein